MTTWNEAVERANSPSGYKEPERTGTYLLPRKKIRIAITGSGGAGKTQLFRQLTGKDVPDKRSSTIDEGRQIYKDMVKVHSLVTVPGQPSKERKVASDFLFGQQSHLDGIIHVCSYGMNEIWSEDRSMLIRSLDSRDRKGLKKANKEIELGDFSETLSLLRNKIINVGHEHHPKWMVILVNKVDLYWDSITAAKGYYHPLDGRTSKFKTKLHEFLDGIGDDTGLRVEVLPFASTGRDYQLRDVGIDIHIKSMLSKEQRIALNSPFFELLEELNK